MKDFLKQELKVGDMVVTVRPQYREFVLAQIIKFTPQKVVVEYDTWYKDSNGNYGKEKFTTNPDFLIKV